MKVDTLLYTYLPVHHPCMLFLAAPVCSPVKLNQLSKLFPFCVKPIAPDSMNEKDSDTGAEGEEDTDDKDIKSKVRFCRKNLIMTSKH